MDILCFSTTDWDEIWGSRQQIMQRIARSGDRILFIERQISFEHLLRDPLLRKRIFSRWHRPLRQELSDSIWVWRPPLVFPGRYYSDQLNNLGQLRLAQSTKSVMNQLKFSHPILWIYPPHSYPLLGKFNERCSVYHCIDRFSGNQKGLKRFVIEFQERLLLQKVDIVFTHAEGLRKKYEHLTRRPITLIPSAADVNHFQSTTKIHPEIRAIPQPRIGIMGTLDGRIDVDLLKFMIINKPEWHFIFLGQVRPGRTNIQTLFHFPNVHNFGPRPFPELPLYLNGMDIFLIPYKVNEQTIYINPLKAYEYLAVGKPIVSSQLPEVSTLRPYVNIADSSDFLLQIDQALKTDCISMQQARRLEAKKHSWDQRVQTMLFAISQFLEESGR